MGKSNIIKTSPCRNGEGKFYAEIYHNGTLIHTTTPTSDAKTASIVQNAVNSVVDSLKDVEIETKTNVAEITSIICITLLIALFAGSPDIADAIIAFFTN